MAVLLMERVWFLFFARRIIIITSSTVAVDELDNKRRCFFSDGMNTSFRQQVHSSMI